MIYNDNHWNAQREITDLLDGLGWFDFVSRILVNGRSQRLQ
jgi:hypothetical protein